jgi:hypothetical protein
MESSVDPREASAALDLVASTRADLADRLVTPWWYHPVLGVMAGWVVAAPAARSLAVWYAAVAAFVVGCAVLARTYRRLTGVWISGPATGRASRWAWSLAVALVVAAGLSALAALTLDAWPVSIAIAVAQLPVTVLLGRRFDVELRRQLRESR